MAIHYNASIPTDGLSLYLDAANPKSWSQNTFSSALDIYTWYVTNRGNNTGNFSTYSQDTTTSRSPANGIPMKMSVTGNDPHTGSYNAATWNIAPATTGQTWILSVWAKASVNTTGELYLFGADATGVASNGAGGFWNITSKSITITTEWQRFDHFLTITNATVAYIQMRLDGPQSGGTGVDVWWDGLQMEKAESSTALSDFNPRYNQNGANWVDLSGNGNNGIVVGNSIVWNEDEKVMKFPGVTGNYITVATPNLSTSNHTVITASRFESSSDNGRVVAGNANNWLLGHHGANYNAYYANAWVNNPTTNNLGYLWRIYAGVGNYTQNYWALYTNGVLVNGNANGANGPNGFSLGRYYISDSQYTPSRISFLMTYDRVLTASEIARVFNAFRGRFVI